MRFEALKETLLKGGIAPRHVARYLRELDDHLADLTAAQREAGHDAHDAAIRARALLGGDNELAAAMLARPELKSWSARAPWLAFGVIPPVVSLASFFLLALPLILIAHWDHRPGHDASQWFQALSRGTAFLGNFALSPALAALMVWAAQRQRLNRIWPLLATAIIALAGFHMTAAFPDVSGHGDRLAIASLQLFRLSFSWAGRGEHLRHYSVSSWAILAQFFLTLAPALWLLRDRFARPREAR